MKSRHTERLGKESKVEQLVGDKAGLNGSPLAWSPQASLNGRAQVLAPGGRVLVSSGTSANLLMFHTCCVASGKSLNLSEHQVPLLRNKGK